MISWPSSGFETRCFIATKVGAEGRDAGIEQLEQSLKRLRTPKIDLVAVHNLRDTQTQLRTLREWKQAGRIRYVGITTSFDRQYQEFEQTMKAETLDFIQVDYALDNRNADQRILPLAADRGMAVMINLPFGRGRLFKAVQGQSLPPWAGEFDCASWAQFFLKYIVSHPAVTCAMPGTAKVEYLVDNLGAARGRLPDPTMRRRMEQLHRSLVGRVRGRHARNWGGPTDVRGEDRADPRAHRLRASGATAAWRTDCSAG